MEKKILAGITKDNELYFLEINATNDKRNGYDEFSMSGFTVKPITEKEAKENANNYLDDEGEYFWRQAVEAKNTTLGLDDWIEQVKAEEEMGMFDNSLYNEIIEIEGENYLFESGACGQHEESELKHYFIPEAQYKAITELWKQYHLKPTPTSGLAKTVMDNALSIEQNTEELVKEAVLLINKDNE